MTIETTLAGTRTSANDAHETFSAAWWEARTAEELRDIINRGFAGGGTFHGAVAETERRARDATRRLREAAVAAASRRKRMKVVAIGALASVAVIAAYAGMWFVR
jgi:hypothetical protein